MNGVQIVVVTIVAMVMFASVLKARYGIRRGREEAIDRGDTVETERLRDEVKQLKERLAVLERITVEKENSLAREIEQLRDRCRLALSPPRPGGLNPGSPSEVESSPA